MNLAKQVFAAALKSFYALGYHHKLKLLEHLCFDETFRSIGGVEQGFYRARIWCAHCSKAWTESIPNLAKSGFLDEFWKKFRYHCLLKEEPFGKSFLEYSTKGRNSRDYYRVVDETDYRDCRGRGVKMKMHSGFYSSFDIYVLEPNIFEQFKIKRKPTHESNRHSTFTL